MTGKTIKVEVVNLGKGELPFRATSPQYPSLVAHGVDASAAASILLDMAVSQGAFPGWEPRFKAFTIMPSWQHRDLQIECPSCVPWHLLNEDQAQKNHYQTLERLNQRGGLSPCEALAVIERRPWRAMNYAEACAKLMALVADGKA